MLCFDSLLTIVIIFSRTICTRFYPILVAIVHGSNNFALQSYQGMCIKHASNVIVTSTFELQKQQYAQLFES